MFSKRSSIIAISLLLITQSAHSKNIEVGELDASIIGPMDKSPELKSKAKKIKIPSTKRDFQKIINRAKARIKKNPKDAHAYIDLGYAYGNLLQPKKDLEYCNKAIKIDPNIPVAYSERAQAYLMLEEEEKALNDLEKAISLDPNNSAFYKTRGWIYGRQGKYAESVGECTRSISIYNGYSPAFYCRGRAFLFLGDYPKAIRDYTEAIRLYPNEVEDYYAERAFAYNSIGEYRKALTDLNTALQINPKHVPSFIYRSISLANLGDERAAISNLNDAINVDPESSNAYAHRGRAYLSLNELDKSIKDLNKAIELNPKENQAYHFRGLWFLQKNKIGDAIEDFKKALSLKSDTKYMSLLARAYMKEKEYENALAIWNKMLEKEPDSKEALSGKAYAEEKSDKATESRKVLTLSELNLAKELNYSTEAMKLVKEATGSNVSKITMNKFGPWKPKLTRLERPSPWTPENINKVKSIATKYPELAPTLIDQIERLEKRLNQRTDTLKLLKEKTKKKIGNEEYEYREKIAKLAPYLAYEREKSGISDTDVLFMEKNVSAKDVYFELRKKVANTKLPRVYLPIDAAVVSLPTDFSPEDIVSLQEKLEPLGYGFFGADNRYVSRRFESRSEAKKFVGRSLEIKMNPSRYTEITYDPEKFDPQEPYKNGFWISPGVDVEKVSSTKWLIKHPKEYSVVGTFKRAVLVKDLDKFDYLRVVGSSGPNYSVTNKMIVNKLKEWDKKLGGIRIISARGDSVQFKVLKEPKDLSRFLTEVFLICPDAIELSPDTMYSASLMRERAAKFRKNRTVGFWWD